MTLPTIEEIDVMQRKLDDLKLRVAAEHGGETGGDIPLKAPEDPNGRINNSIFSWKGRITRLRYFTTMLLVFFVYLPIATFSNIMQQSLSPDSDLFLALAVGVLACLAFISALGVFAGIKRCHDIRINPWWNILNFVPLACLVFFLYLCFARSKWEG